MLGFLGCSNKQSNLLIAPQRHSVYLFGWNYNKLVLEKVFHTKKSPPALPFVAFGYLFILKAAYEKQIRYTCRLNNISVVIHHSYGKWLRERDAVKKGYFKLEVRLMSKRWEYVWRRQRDTLRVCLYCVCVCGERETLRDEAETAAIYIPFCSYREQPPSA